MFFFFPLLCVYYLVRSIFFSSIPKKPIVFYLMEVNILSKMIVVGDFYWIFALAVC